MIRFYECIRGMSQVIGFCWGHISAFAVLEGLRRYNCYFRCKKIILAEGNWTNAIFF